MQGKPSKKSKASPLRIWGNLFRNRESLQDSIAESLRQVPLFQDLTRKERKAIEDRVYLRTYKAGETIFRQGEPGLGMYIIHKGSVRIRGVPDPDEDACEPFLDLQKGDFFGEVTLLQELPHMVSAQATTPCRLLGFFRPDFFTLIHYHPRLGTKLLLALGQVMAARLHASLPDEEEGRIPSLFTAPLDGSSSTG
jgi:CRP-like cAMP-binding protein